MRNFKDLKVWEKAHHLCLSIYTVTNNFPAEEKFGIISQLRRASVSVPTNISEGCGYDTQKEFARFLRIASGSISEVEYLVLLSKDLDYITQEEHDILTKESISIRKMLYRLVQSLV